MALSTCKVCQKAICLMCVHEEKDGTFCSEACIGNLREVNDWVGTGSPPPAEASSRPQSMAAAVETPPAASSVFEEMPDAPVSHPDPVAIPDAPPAEEPPAEEPPPSTSSIGNPCFAHPDIRAKAFCRRCRKPICGLCIIENAAGMFCSDACASQSRSRKSGLGTKLVVAVIVLLAAGAALYALKPELFAGLMGGAQPPDKKVLPPKPEPPKPKPQPPKPEPPKPPKPEPPKPEPPKPDPVKPVTTNPEPPRPLPPLPKPERPKPTIMVHPWQSDEPGVWYRVRRGDRVEDVGLKERDAVSYTVATQAWNKGQAEAGAEKKVDVEPIELLGEEPVQVEGRSYLCQIRRVNDRQEWTLVAGRHAGAVLKVAAPDASNEAVRVWEHTITVGNRDFDCLVVEARQGDGNILKTWYCPSYPLKTVRIEREGVLLESLVGWGGSWTSRPAPK